LRQQLQSDAVKGVKDLPEEHVCSEYCQLCRERGEL
jgi:hypothetical protein